ncbi:MAG TPA: hypothetical protein VK722_02185 [Candidatus Aquilonibacter sp.]|jgi:hypothetical protein|nr:hypothetical protein [Candidatus Aquilonibacter sp.]
MSNSRVFLPRVLFLVLAISAMSATLSAEKKEPPPPPKPAHTPTPAVNNEYVHKEFGDNCSLLGGPPQFVGDLDGDGVDDLVVAGRCKNPMADQAEYGFLVIDPYDKFLGFGDVKVTSTFASDEPERKGVCLLVVHGVGTEAWHSDKPKQKYVMINLPFKTLTVKKLALKKRTVLGVYMEEQGEGEQTSSVVFWDGKRYRYQILGADFE